MILGFTGTRSGPRPDQTQAIYDFMARLKPRRFVHGGAAGCDMIAHGIAERLHIPVIEIHPSIDHYPAVAGITAGVNVIIFPPLPPLERNRVIVRRVWGMLACPRTDAEEAGTGTWYTVRQARKLGCPVYLIRADGTIVRDIDPVFR